MPTRQPQGRTLGTVAAAGGSSLLVSANNFTKDVCTGAQERLPTTLEDADQLRFHAALSACQKGLYANKASENAVCAQDLGWTPTVKRPRLLILVVVFELTRALLGLLGAAALIAQRLDVLMAGTILVISAALLAIAIGLWRMRNWARLSLLALAGTGFLFSLIVTVYEAYSGEGSPLELAPHQMTLYLALSILDLLPAAYLLTPGARRTFRTATLVGKDS